jgi:hypothetical protein
VRRRTETYKISRRRVVHFPVPLLQVADPVHYGVLDVAEPRLLNHQFPALDEELQGQDNMPHGGCFLILEGLLYVRRLLVQQREGGGEGQRDM